MKCRLLAVWLCLCLLFAAVPFTAAAAETEQPLMGTVFGMDPGNRLYVREKDSLQATVLDKLDNGAEVTILGYVVTDGKRWCHLRTASGVEGYSSAEYIRVNPPYENDAEFEAYLTAQGFPESYKAPLRKLYATFPNWVFKAQHLSMTWAEALAGENEPLKNSLNINDYPEAWLSMEYGTYNWKTNKYVEMDSGGWVTASPRAVAYFMDPRNFLDSMYIFQFEDLLYSEQHTLEGVQAILPTRFDGYAADLLRAAADANVSAYFLATRMTQEGTKIDGTFVGDGGVSYKGYYNFFNYGAYAGSQHGAYHGAVTNGAIYAQKQGWDTPYKCIYDSALALGRNYIHRGQNTTYYQKFNVAGENLYYHQYMSNINAPTAESKTRATKASEAELQGYIGFVIPVYKDMPDTPVPKPSEIGNNNNFLESLSVSGCSVTPSFNRYTMEYAANVAGSVTEVTVTAVPSSSEAVLSGVGTVKLKAGENLIPITVTATSGEVRTYTLCIFRDAPAADLPTFVVENGTAYEGEEVTVAVSTRHNSGIVSLKLSVHYDANLLEPVSVKEQDFANVSYSPLTNNPLIINWLDAIHPDNTTDGVVSWITFRIKEGAPIGSTAITVTYDPEDVYDADFNNVDFAVESGTIEIANRIPGDVNGDGKVNNQDLGLMQQYLNAWQVSIVEEVADVTDDGRVNNKDMGLLQRYLTGWDVELK